MVLILVVTPPHPAPALLSVFFLRAVWPPWIKSLPLEVFDEPLHNDGGASAVHFSLTLAGRRDLECHLDTGEAKIENIENKPGTLYFGGLVGCKHQAMQS